MRIASSIQVRPDGFYESANGAERLVAPPLRFLAKAFLDDGSGNFHEVAFKTANGKTRRASIPHALITNDGRQALKLLADAGYPLPRSADAQEAILQWLMAEYLACKRIVLTRSVTGWYDHGSFLLGSREVAGSRGLRLMQSLESVAGHYEERGTLAGWQQEVAIPAAQSSFMMVGILLGFAAPLARIVGVSSGGFNFPGSRGAGKTATMKVAASVYGAVPPFRSWDMSDLAPDTLAQSHNDLPLLLDEIGALGQPGPATAKRLATSIYRLCTGAARVVSHRASTKPDENVDTTTLLLSTSELPVRVLLRSAHGDVPAGALTRLLDIPLHPACQGGVLDQPAFAASGKAPTEVLTQLWRATDEHAGVVGRIYLQRLRAEMQKGPEQLKRSIEASMRVWEERSGSVIAASTDPRAVRRLALLYAVGRLAASWALLPKEFNARSGVVLQECLMESQSLEGANVTTTDVFDRLKKALAAPGALCARGDAKIGDPLGYRRHGLDGSDEILVRKVSLGKLMGSEMHVLLDECRALGVLKLDTRGSNFHRQRVPGAKGELESVLILNAARLK